MAILKSKNLPPDENLEKAPKTAVALRYEPEKEQAPLVVAAGKGTVAQEILKIAEENNIPLYEDPNLAQLLSKIEINMEIPAQLYTLVAEVLSFVYRLDQMASKRKKVEEQISRAAPPK
jgi:flagellar biosynthesis protein